MLISLTKKGKWTDGEPTTTDDQISSSIFISIKKKIIITKNESASKYGTAGRIKSVYRRDTVKKKV